MHKILISIFLSILLSSCASYKYGSGEENTQKSNLTMGMVKTKIIKGETKQSDILHIFGAPNLVSKNRSDNEVWSYNKMNTTKKRGESYYLFGDRASVSSSNQSFDLIITFDNNEIVTDYSVISSTY